MARYTGQILAPVEGFGRDQGFFCLKKKKPTFPVSPVFCYFWCSVVTVVFFLVVTKIIMRKIGIYPKKIFKILKHYSNFFFNLNFFLNTKKKSFIYLFLQHLKKPFKKSKKYEKKTWQGPLSVTQEEQQQRTNEREALCLILNLRIFIA